MNTGGIQFKKFKQDFHCKNLKTKTNIDATKPIYYVPKIRQQVNAHSPHRQPTSFRELSGSREKNKLFSGKKAALENKLNTLRSNQKDEKFEISNDDKSRTSNYDSAKKQGLFTKLLTSRSPTSVKKNLAFDESNGSSNATSDNSGISFSAFKGISLGENENLSNLVMHKVASADEQKDKGLKFRGFPHKRNNVNNPVIKTKGPCGPMVILTEGPLICKKGQSKSKNKQTNRKMTQTKSPTKVASKLQTGRTNYNGRGECEDQYGLRRRVEQNSTHQTDEVIRSREGSITFDMSPTLC